MPNYFQPVNPYGVYPNQFAYPQTQAIYQSQPQAINQSPQQNSSQGIIWVQGEAGAKSYIVNPNQSILLMDSEASTFYIKSSDSSGMPLPLRIFDYQERTSNGQQASPIQETSQIDTSQFVTHEEFDKFKNEFFNRKKQSNSTPIPKEGQ